MNTIDRTTTTADAHAPKFTQFFSPNKRNTNTRT